MYRFALVICCSCWGYLAVRIFAVRPDVTNAMIWSGIELIFFAIFAAAVYVCRRSRIGIRVLSVLCLLSFLAATMLLVPPLTPPIAYGSGILAAWCLFLQAVLAMAAVFVCAYVTDTPVAYKVSGEVGGKLLAAALIGIPALFLIGVILGTQ